MSARAATAAGAVVLAALALGGPAYAQEMDDAVFHYSRLQVDASRSPGSTVGRWDAGGWVGTDFDRLWWSTSGERASGSFGAVEATVLYGHYAKRFWDVVVGYRQDFEPALQGYLGIGVMGLAPYWFEIALLGFVSQRGRPSLRFEAENDLFVTQRLLLQPSLHVDWLVTDDDTLDLARGVRALELGIRARYEIRRKLAPYVDFTWVREQDERSPRVGDAETEGIRWGLGLRLIY